MRPALHRYGVNRLTPGDDILRNGGFSLVELMIAIVVMGIVFAAGLPAFGSFRDTLLRDEARALLLQDLRMARQTAVTRHCPAVVRFGSGSGTTNLTGYAIHFDANADLLVQSGERRFLRVMPGGTRLASVDLQPADSLVFDMSGLLRPGTSGGRIVIVTPRGKRDTLVVSVAGMAYAL